MAEDISLSKNGSPWTISFDTKIPTLGEDANIQDALKLFYFGNTDLNQTFESKSIYQHFLTLKSITDSLNVSIGLHNNNATDTHQVGAGNSIVGTGTTQTLTNKRLDSPKINGDVVLTATSSELNKLTGSTPTTAEINRLSGLTATTAELNKLTGVTSTSTEISHLSGVTSNVQSQISLKAPLASPTFTGSVNLPDDTKFGGKRLFIQATQPLSANNGDVWIKIGI